MRRRLRPVPKKTITNIKNVKDLNLWLDASDSNTLTLSSGVATTWVDKSGVWGNYTASTTARPTQLVADQNGLNTLQFDGTANYMASPTMTNRFQNIHEETVFVVAKIASSDTPTTSWGFFGVNSANHTLRVITSGETALEFIAENSTAGTGALRTSKNSKTNVMRGGYRLWSGRRSTNKNFMEVSENGIELSRTTHSRGAVNKSSFWIGRDGFSNFFKGSIAEIVIVHRAMPDWEYKAVQEILRAKWNLYTHFPFEETLHPDVRRLYYANNYTSLGDYNLIPLVLLGGQSNCVGRGPKADLPGDLIGPQTGRYIYVDGTQTWAQLEVGVNNMGLTNGDYHGIEPTLMKQLKTNYGTDVYLVKYGTEGEPLFRSNPGWKPDVTTGSWQEFILRINTAIRVAALNGIGLDIRALVWIQGESDSQKGPGGVGDTSYADAYQLNEKELIYITRQVLNKPNLRWLSGLVNAASNSPSTNTYPYTSIVRTAKIYNAANMNNVLTFAGPTDVNTETVDTTHWNSALLQTAGTAVANAITA